MQCLLALRGALLWGLDRCCIVAEGEPIMAQRVEAGARLSGLSADTVCSKLYHFFVTGEIHVEDASLRGAGSPKSAQAPLPAATEADISEWVRDALEDKTSPKWITRQSIQNKIRESTGVHCSFRRITRLVDRWGLDYQMLIPWRVQSKHHLLDLA
jgi:hypothetical protein